MAKTTERDSRPLARGDDAMPWIVAGIAAVVALIYALFFFAVPVGNSQSPLIRLHLFLQLLRPDDIVSNAVGHSFSWRGVRDRFAALLATSGMIAYAVVIGAYVHGWMAGQRRGNLVESLTQCAGIGLHFLSLMTLAVGLLGLLRWPVLVGLMVVGLVASPRSLRPYLNEAGNLISELRWGPKDRRWLLWLLLPALFAVPLLLGAALPPWDFDVREYHLQIPKEWYQAGRITFAPHNIYANMPLDAEMLPLAAMSVLSDWWQGAIVGKCVMGACAILTAVAIYALVKRLASPLAAMIAAAVWLSHPWVVHVSIGGLNEPVYALYLTLAVSAVATNDATWRNWLLAGFFAGAAAACKYPAVVMLVLPMAAWAAIAPRIEAPLAAPWRLRLAAVACFIAAAAFSGGAWYVKNWVQAGNPVYPLLGDVLDGKTRTPEKNAQFARGHAVPPYTAGKLAESLVRIGWESEHQSPLVVPLGLLGIAVLVVQARRARGRTDGNTALSGGLRPPLAMRIGVAALLAFFVASWWLFTHRLDRFLVPATPLAAAIVGIGVEFALARPLKWVVYPLLVVGLVYNLAYISTPMPLAVVLAGDDRWLVTLAELRRDEPHERDAISRINDDIRWLNEHVPKDQAVLCVGEAAVFDLEMPVYYNTCFDDCLLVEWMSDKSAPERKQLLHDQQIAFVYVDWDEIERYKSPGNYGFDPRFSRALLDELVAQQVLGPPRMDAPPEMYPVLP